MFTDEIRRSFRQWCQWGYGAAESLEKARADKVARYPSTGRNIGAEFGDGLRWIERPQDAGLRFVGFADDVAPQRVEHRGWYTRTDDYSETLRAAVYQLPTRSGRPVYVPGYQEIGFGVDGAAVVALRDLFRGDVGGCEETQYIGRYRRGDYEGETAARDAASRADRIAEIAAEKEREFSDAWQAARRWQDLQQTTTTEKAAARTLIRDMRAARRADVPESICAALRATVRRHLQAAADALSERGAIADNFGYWQDGRRVDVAEFAAVNL